MNYSVYKFTESEHSYYFYFISHFDEDIELVSESIEHYIGNVPTEMNKFLIHCDFDNVKIEKVNISPIDVLNKSFQPDDKNMLISNSFVSLIPVPKPKPSRKKTETVDKPPKKEAKPRPKKQAQKAVIIDTSNTTLQMS